MECQQRQACGLPCACVGMHAARLCLCSLCAYWHFQLRPLIYVAGVLLAVNTSSTHIFG